jgi:hypothetical protein
VHRDGPRRNAGGHHYRRGSPATADALSGAVAFLSGKSPRRGRYTTRSDPPGTAVLALGCDPIQGVPTGNLAPGGIRAQRCGSRIRHRQRARRLRRRHRTGPGGTGMARRSGVRVHGVRAGFRREWLWFVHWRDGHLIPLSRVAGVPLPFQDTPGALSPPEASCSITFGPHLGPRATKGDRATGWGAPPVANGPPHCPEGSIY